MEPGSSQLCTVKAQGATDTSCKRGNSNEVSTKRKNHYEGDQTLKQVAQRDYGISNPGDNQIHAGRGPEQPDLSWLEVWVAQMWCSEVHFQRKLFCKSILRFCDFKGKKKKKTKPTTQNHTCNMS